MLNMVKFRYKRYSAVASGRVLNTNQGLGFKRGRKYDTDLDRLGRMETAQRELSRGMGTFNQEMRKLNKELRGGDSYGNIQD